VRHVDATPFLDEQRDRVDASRLTLLAKDRPVYVVAGAGGRRVLDLLSPFARRLRAELAVLGAAVHNGARADDVYAGVDALCAADDDVDAERLGVEASDGVMTLGPGAAAIRCEQLGDVDGRVREAAASLKRRRALVVCVEERASSLMDVLDAVHAAGERDCAALFIVVNATEDAAPNFVVEAASGHVATFDNTLAATRTTMSALSLPSLELRGAATTGLVDDTLFPLVQAALRARIRGFLDVAAPFGVKTVRADDVSSMSRCCIDVLRILCPPPRARLGR
jgi:hypothetical protein